jgi:Ca2+-binding RTX toxin-like protein
VGSCTEKSRIADRKGGQVRYRHLTPALALSALVLLGGTALAAIMCSGECSGTGMDDRLLGSPQNDSIYAGAGDDKARGGEGDDFIKGESGNDGVYGQEGNDRIKGNGGEDTVFGGPGDDKVRGGSHGNANDGAKDILDCGQGMDTVYFTDVDVVSDDCEVENPPE